MVISFYVLSGSILKLDQEIALTLKFWGGQGLHEPVHFSGIYSLNYINNSL